MEKLLEKRRELKAAYYKELEKNNFKVFGKAQELANELGKLEIQIGYENGFIQCFGKESRNNAQYGVA